MTASSADLPSPPDREEIAFAPPPRILPAWFGSVAVHFLAITTFAALVRDTPRGLPGENPRTVGLTLAQIDGRKTEYFGEGKPQEAGESGVSRMAVGAAAESAAPFPAAEEKPATTSGPKLPKRSANDGGFGVGDFNPAASGLLGAGTGSGTFGKGSGAGETSVFGVRGIGTRFVYVFDRSASMSGFEGKPLAAAKRELLGSISQLARVHQFQILFYNDQPALMNPARLRNPPLFFADDQNRRLARDYVQGVVADGGTRHVEALKIALRLNPDVIFFLTDGDEPQLRPSELAEIRRLNRGAAIHAIEFGNGEKQSGVSFLEKLAQQNDGDYTYVNIRRLPEAE